MADPLRTIGVRETPQSQPVLGKTMAPNSAGGYTFEVDDWTRALRFLVLGTEGGTYYVSERNLTVNNAAVVQRLAATEGERLVQLLVDVSEAARAPRVQPTLYALAVCCASADEVTRRAAFAAIPRICRTGTHLFTFAHYVEARRGWGRGLRAAVARWYERPLDQVAYQAVKYRQREGWSHRDLLRLSHPSGEQGHADLFDWICGRPIDTTGKDDLRIIEGFERVQAAGDSKTAAGLIAEYDLPWEAVPDHFLTEASTWDAILDIGMGITALIRNLARLTRLGVIAPMAGRTRAIASRISDGDELRRGKVHPIQLLDALLTYQQGHGARGQDNWAPVATIVDALDAGFYSSFAAVVPADKRTMLALDVSGSMSWQACAGSVVLTPAVASAAMALVTAATEPTYMLTAFSDHLVQVSISPRQRLDDVRRELQRITMGGTDCSLPILTALQQQIPVDTFVVYTDNETWAGRIHPFQALQQYRQQMGIAARLIVCGMTSTGFTIADPSDPGMLDVAGFDGATPSLISGFSRGEI